VKKLLVVLVVLLSGCATTKPLQIACISCQLLEATGLCAAAARRAPCPEGQRYEILNYQRWIDGQETPVVECRRYSIQ